MKTTMAKVLAGRTVTDVAEIQAVWYERLPPVQPGRGGQDGPLEFLDLVLDEKVNLREGKSFGTPAR